MLRVRLWVCLMFVSAATACAQQFPFIQVTPRPPAGCLFPFQDSRGRLWLAGCETGSEGLYVFDGARYLSPLPDGALKGIVRGMADDSEGGIWISSTSGIYRLYKAHLEKIVDGVAAAGIIKIAPDVFLAAIGKSGTEFLLRADAIRIARAGGAWKSDAVIHSIPQVQFRVDHTGQVLYGCSGGFCEVQADAIVRWRPGSNIPIKHHELGLPPDYAESSSVVLRDEFGCVWLRAGSRAAYKCPAEPHPTIFPAATVSGGYPQIFELHDGTIILPGFSEISIGRPGRFRTVAEKAGYPGTAGASLMRDESLWLSSGYILPLHVRMEFWSGQNECPYRVRSLQRVESRLFANSPDRVCVLASDGNQWQSLARIDRAMDLVAGPGRTVLVSSLLGGVVQMTTEGRILRRSAPTEVSMLIRAADGAFWALGQTLYRIAFEGDRLSLKSSGAPILQAATGDLKLDRQGTLWACNAGGLMREESNRWHISSISGHLPEKQCGSMAIDHDGDIWYGYQTLQAFSWIHNPASADPALKYFSSNDDIGSAASYSFASDLRGWLWRGSADGIYVADAEQAQSGRWLHLDREAGLPSLDANGRSFFEDTDGSVWFGLEESLIHLHPPSDLVHPTYSPLICVSAFSLDGGPAHLADTIGEFKHGSDITAYVGLLQYDRPSAVGIRYRVLPDRAAWTAVKNRDIHLGRIPWGHHTLQVQAQLQSGPWSVVSEQSFSVLRPAWLSWPTLLLLGAGGGSLGAGMSRWRKRQRYRRELLLPDITAWRMDALSPETEHLIGTILDDRYEIGHILSIGGFATVVRARDLQESGKLCAVKIFRYELADQAWIRHRFEQEVTALEQLSHPNIVGITGHGTVDTGAPYLVMEFIQGRSIRERLAEGALPREKVARFLRQLIGALEALHRRAIYHRDLKPENLMIRADADNEEQLVLIDFSIAIVKSPDQTFHGISRVAGTLGYMAPEQVIGYADASTDIHALAKVVVEMLTGSRWTELLPEGTLDMTEFLRGYLAKNPCGLAPDSIEMLASALAFDPTRRPQDVPHFGAPIIRDLERVS